MNRKLPLAMALLLLPACDKADQPTTPPTSDSGATPSGEGGDDTEPGAPGVPWKDKTFDQRQEYMGIAVMPAMKELFKAYDENEFKQFKCQTCHGDDMNDVKFKMPTDSIYPLDPKDPIKGAMEYDEKMTKFMQDKVVPDMAKLLDMQPGTEFGCMSCHPAE